MSCGCVLHTLTTAGPIWCFPVASFFFYLPPDSSSFSLFFFSPSLHTREILRLSLFSRNNLISLVVRSFYFTVFSDPFRLVWQLMQPIFRLVSFSILTDFINQYVNSFRFFADDKHRKLTFAERANERKYVFFFLRAISN